MTKIRIQNATEFAVYLSKRHGCNGSGIEMTLYGPAAIADLVHQTQRAARIIHKHDERRCNEDLTCPHCQGDGCRKCANGGDTLSRQDARLLEQLQAAIKPYRLRVYEQGDPRGWPLYLIPEESGPASEDDGYYNMRGFAICPH